MKKFLLILLAVCLLAGFAGCSKADPQTEKPDPDVNQPTDKPDQDTDNKKTLVVYFSASGNTKAAAEKIAKITGADIYQILPAQPYSSADLNWHDSNSRTTHEQNDSSVRPEISSEKLDLTGYDTIYIGYPIWWGEEPRIMDTFVESYDFGDITMIPFCTSSSSGMGRSGKNLANNAKSGNWQDGKRFSESVSESELKSWIDNLNK